MLFYLDFATNLKYTAKAIPQYNSTKETKWEKSILGVLKSIFIIFSSGYRACQEALFPNPLP
ncbi:hypothetical protein [Geminocystis sp. GBBB08]|uniref:hypothetical protein n=1 Tax=Geminocystis sp. GBBB08 TaxID=2604140 RepID=UPI0027E35C01|nr:hypothetical protein [Geminocystis sp. GBBB08]MBL1211466.1 hypothetical protein [Geminocystis sp. GBBB08]